MSLSLFALHSIKRMVKPAKIEKDHFGRLTQKEAEEVYYVEPGTIFEAIDEKEWEELVDAEAARPPTARELKLDEAGLLVGDGAAGQPSQKSVAKIEAEAQAQEQRDQALLSASQKREEPISKRAAASAKTSGRRRGVV